MATREPLQLNCENGAGDGTRTRDLLITSQLLYQLSYTGTCYNLIATIVAHVGLKPPATKVAHVGLNFVTQNLVNGDPERTRTVDL